MIDKGVANRYAHALFGAALARDRIDRVLDDLDALERLLRQDASLLKFLESPRELDEHKRELVEKLFAARIDELSVRLLLLLLRKKRILHFPDVIQAYRGLVDAQRGVAQAGVTTALSLPEDLAERLRSGLEASTGKKVRLKTRIDPQIIAGLVVTIEGKILDRSVRNELDRLRDDLLAARMQ